MPRVVPHTHVPVFRVRPARDTAPLDSSFSTKANDNRWNTGAFPALYCSCSLTAARAVTRHIFQLDSYDLEDLQPGFTPRLYELSWEGVVVDVATADGVAAAGFPASYPRGVAKTETRAKAQAWQQEGHEGVVCRSNSMAFLGFAQWEGSHENWAELAIFTAATTSRPTLLKAHEGLDWLQPT